jgi:hypothetical protein
MAMAMASAMRGASSTRAARTVILFAEFFILNYYIKIGCPERQPILYIGVEYYFVTLSKRFIMMNMKRAESKQSTMNTVHTDHNGIPAQRKPPTATSMLPIAVATNQPPIIRPLSFGGATFDTNEIPIGERSNSANVRIK